MIRFVMVIALLWICSPLSAQVISSSVVIEGQKPAETAMFSKWDHLIALAKPHELLDDYNHPTSRTGKLVSVACNTVGIENLYHRAVNASRSDDTSSYPQDPTAFDGVLDQIIEIVQKADTKSGSYPALLYCFDGVAELRMQFVENIMDGWGENKASPKSSWAERQKELSKAGLNYFVDRTAGIHLSRKTLRKLAENYPGTFWGQEALLEETQLGCNPDVANEEDHFRIVIRRLSEFLSAYPSSPFAIPLTLELARAYETWWSLANNARGEFQQGVSKYKGGSEKARLKAIELYQKYLGWQANENISKRVHELELKHVPGNTRFYCLDE